MKRDISVLFEGLQGIEAWFHDVTAADKLRPLCV